MNDNLSKEEKKIRKKHNKEIRKLAKARDIKTYVSKYGNDRKSIEVFIHDVYIYQNHVIYTKLDIDFKKEFIRVFKSLSYKDQIEFLIYGNFGIEKNSELFINNRDEFKENYLARLIVEGIDFKEALNDKARAHFYLTDQIITLAIKNARLLDLLESFTISNDDVKSIDYVRDYCFSHAKGGALIRFLNSYNFKLSNDELIEITKKSISSMIENGLIHDFFAALSKYAMDDYYDFSEIRNIVLSLNNDSITGAYILCFGDLNVSKEDFIKACKYSWEADKEIVQVFYDALFDLKNGVNEEFLELFYMYGCCENDEAIEEDPSVYIGPGPYIIMLSTANEMIDNLNNVVLDSNYKDRIKNISEGKLNDIELYIERIFSIIMSCDVEHLNAEKKEKYSRIISKFVDLSLNMQKNPYFDTFLDPIDIACNIKIKSKKVNDKIIDYLLGEGNEVDLKRLNYYKKFICDIKYLDDENILKIAPYYITDENYYYVDFIKMVDRISNASILYDIINKTNNIGIMSNYAFTCKDKKTLSSKYYSDKDNGLNNAPKRII